MTAKLLPHCQWCLDHNGIIGPIAEYDHPAFWPSMDKPEIIALTGYFGEPAMYRIHSEIPLKDTEWKDCTLPEKS